MMPAKTSVMPKELSNYSFSNLKLVPTISLAGYTSLLLIAECDQEIKFNGRITTIKQELYSNKI